MTAKLRSIRTITRAATVKRRDVTSAVKEIVVSRDASTGRFIDRKGDRKSASATRK